MALAALLARPAPVQTRVVVSVALAAGVVLAIARVPAGYDARPHAVTLSGVVVDSPRAEAFGSTFPLRLADGTTVEVTAAGAPPAVGARLRVRGRLEPFDSARNPGEPSARALAGERGLTAQLARGRTLATDAPDGRDASTWIPRLRAWASAAMRAHVEEPEASILAGALWGERGTLPPDLRSEFQDTGTVHILVTAGLHLGVVAALVAWLLELGGCGRVASSLLGIVAVWLYAAFSGAHLPSLRAATMISFGLAARACGREPFSWNALGAAAIAIAILWTPEVESLSFALSFSCVAAIMLFAKPIAHALERVRLRGFAGEAIALTIATQIGTWPLGAAAFLVIAPYAVVANALVVPVVGIAMVVGFAQVATSPVGAVSQALANLDESLVLWIVSVVRGVAGLPGAHLIATPPPLWAIVAYDAAMVAVAALLRCRRYAYASLALVAAAALVAWPPRPVSHNLIVTAVDVGQADGLLIRTPSGHAYIVDAGGKLERGPDVGGASPAEAVGERVMVPFLIRQGIHHVDAVLLSHPHGDHVGGVPPVLRALGADLFADSGQTYPGHAYHDALDVLGSEHVPIVYPRGGTVWNTDDGVAFRFYSPTLPLLTNTRNDINNNSLVFRLEYGHFRMLFTGDAGAEAEARILASGADVRADVLKVGHHGSAYSSTPEFIRAVSPRYAVISVGRNNLFGHPAPSTLETLAHAGARVYRTDEDGAVTIDTDGAGGVRITTLIARR
jgi:competence protein ComEC